VTSKKKRARADEDVSTVVANGCSTRLIIIHLVRTREDYPNVYRDAFARAARRGALWP